MYRLFLERIDISMSIILCYAVLSCSVMSNSLQCHGLQPTRLLCSRGFSRQEYWSGLPALLQGIFPTQGIELSSPTLQMNSLPSELQGKPTVALINGNFILYNSNNKKSGLKLQTGSFADVFQIELKLTWLGRSGVQIFPLLHIYADLTNCFLLILL